MNIKHVFAVTFRSAGVRNFRTFHLSVDSPISANVILWEGADSHVNEQLSGYEVAPAFYMPDGKMVYEVEVFDMEAENETDVVEELLRYGFTEIK